jgi:regulation of enolase protein 1 (concanavalin A-like superfamily)
MTLRIPTLPPLAWTGAAGDAEFDAEHGTLTVRAAAGVDWTNDAAGGAAQHTATALSFPPGPGDFALSARVRLDGVRTTFDAGAIALWSDRDHWAKLCHEFSPQGQPMVVSVVTDGWSDDANGATVPGDAVHLRVARVGSAIAFHSSLDGEHWDFVRLFRLEPGAEPFVVGFLSQAPTGERCEAVFDLIRYTRETIGDLRDGS